MNKLANKLFGIVPPVVTPFLDDNSVDQDSTYKLMDYLIKGGIHSLFILGTTGEGPLTPIETQREFVKVVSNYVKKVPILVGVSDISTIKVINNINKIANFNIDGIVSTLPMYYSTDKDEQLQHFKSIADSSPVPLILYDIPQRVGTKIMPSVVMELANHSNIAGLKDSSGNLRNFRSIVERLGDDREFTLLLGDSSMIDISVLIGADGVVPSDAHFYPELCVMIYELAKKGKWEEARKQQRKLNFERQEIYNKYPNIANIGCKISKKYLKEKMIISSEKSLRL